MEDTQALIDSVADELTEGSPDQAVLREDVRGQPTDDDLEDGNPLASSRRGMQLGLAAAAAAVIVIGASLLFFGRAEDEEQVLVATQEPTNSSAAPSAGPNASPDPSPPPPDDKPAAEIAVAGDGTQRGLEDDSAGPSEGEVEPPSPQAVASAEAVDPVAGPSQARARDAGASSDPPAPATRSRRPPSPPPPAPEPPEPAPVETQPAPSRPASPPPPQDPADLLRAAKQANKNGRPDQGYRLAAQSYRQTRSSDAAETMTHSACMMRNRQRAEAALKNVRMLRRLHVKSLCRSVGMNL